MWGKLFALIRWFLEGIAVDMVDLLCKVLDFKHPNEVRKKRVVRALMVATGDDQKVTQLADAFKEETKAFVLLASAGSDVDMDAAVQALRAAKAAVDALLE